MSIGNIIYYILWPFVMTAVAIIWAFEIILEILKYAKDAIEDAHEGIKEG
jgi:hypothetical protein